MIDKVQQDMKEAMKAKDKPRLDALRYLKSILLENKVSKSPKEEMDVLTAYLKKLKSNIDVFPEGNEQRVKAENELKVLAEYGPKELEEQEVDKLITDIIAANEGAQFGQVMKELSAHIKGRFDGKKATDMVKKHLN